MSKDLSLFVSECFYSVQGEGTTTGVPAVFLRLSGCNILCKSENWICDTIEVWRKGTKTEFEKVLTYEMIDNLRRGAHLVITGGEPLLHTDSIERFLNFMKSAYGLVPYIEIETNGTIKASQKLKEVVSQWNISPKLKGSGVKSKDRFKPEVILDFTNSNLNTFFKFVISNEEDLLEVLEDFKYLVRRNEIILMPAGDTREQLEKSRLKVVEFCKENVLRFTDRNHVTIWNKKTGV